MFINIADRFAIFLSSLCIVHCLLLPIILLVLPVMTSVAFLADEGFHIWLLLAVLPVSLLAIILGYGHHRNRFIVMTAIVGNTVLVLAAILGHQTFGELGEIMASVIGALLVVYTHVKNVKGRKVLHQC